MPEPPATFEEFWASVPNSDAHFITKFAKEMMERAWDAATANNAKLIMGMGYRMAWQSELLSIMAQKQSAKTP